MKSILVLAAFAVAASSFGSYELLYVVDRATTGTKVHRFDGDTGTYFGSFGADLSSVANGIAINSADEVFVSDSQKIFVYQGSTGSLIREFSLTSVIGLMNLSLTSTGDLLVADFNGKGFRVNATTGAILATYTPPAGTSGVSALFQGPTGHIFAAIRNLNKIQRYQLNGTLDSLSGVTDSLGDASYGTKSGSIGYCATGAGKKIVSFDMSGNPATILPSVDVSGFTAFGITGLAVGHGNRMYASVWSSSSTGFIQRFEKGTGFTRGSFGSSILKNPVNMASVVAPEPTSFAIFGMAVAALVATRRKRNA